jgi:DNA polymerase elongation subunit (family B)
MPIDFHILDAAARDERVVAKDGDDVAVAYDDCSVDSDEEYHGGNGGAAAKKVWGGKADHSQKALVIHLFGKTADGRGLRCDVKGFKPFFYIRCPDGPATVHEQSRLALREYIRRHISPPRAAQLVELERCHRKELFGFTQDKAVPMVKVTVPNLGLFRDVKSLFCNGEWKFELKKINKVASDSIGGPFGKSAPIIYEANLDPMLRFFHLRDLKPCNWASLDGVCLDDLDEDSYNVIECDWEDIAPCAKPPAATAPFKMASWDIECMSTTGAFPVALKGDPIIQIGVILATLGSTAAPEKHIFVLGTCDQIPEGIVHCYKDERKLLLGWFEWMAEQDIDIFMGYNIHGFDERYVWERCEQLGIQGHAEIQQLNRLHEVGGEMKLEEKRLSSSALGDNFMFLWTTPGRIRVDMYHYIKRGYPLPSYKLDDTSRNFLGEKVSKVEEKVDAWELTIGATTKQDVAQGRSVVLLNAAGDSLCEKLDVIEYAPGRLVVSIPDDVIPDEVTKWAVVKDDLSPKEMFKMHGQGPSERAIIARYCVQDCQLVLDLFKKLEVFNNSMSMANVCSVPVSYIFLRGQGIKIESLMFKYCYERGQCIKVLPGGGGGDGETYEGAIVLDPMPGFYTTPVGVADFASLYPSTIISENISHDTLVWVKDFDDNGNLLAVVYGGEEYDNLPGVRYTDIEYDNMIDDPADQRKMKAKIKAGTRVCRYAQDKIGTIPHIVAGLLAARKAKRKEGEKESDPFKKALLDSEQLAYKLTANSLYGQLGSGTFKVRLRPLAASVTAYGRKQIMFSKAAIEKFYGKDSGNPRCAAETVYGDTDSLFIAFHPKNVETGEFLQGKAALEETINLTVEAGKFVTKMLKAPHDFEFDKVYYPFIIFSKKRYVGHKFEENADKYVLAFMGVALKRRDYAAIVKRIYSGALNILLHERDVPKAAAFVRQMSVDLVEGKFGLQPLIISKSLRAEYADPSRIAHKALADRMAARDPGNAPASGDRIPFVYIQPPVGQVAPDLQGERIETPTYIKEKGLKPDYMFYIDHQICNPVCQLFGLVVDQLPGYSDYKPRGGWKNENPDTLTVQRETCAYHLLFGDAIQKHKMGATKAFASMLGATTTAKTVGKRSNVGSAENVIISMPVPVAKAVGEVVKKQSTLDSMFMAAMRVNAEKQVAARKKKLASAETTPKAATNSPKDQEAVVPGSPPAVVAVVAAVAEVATGPAVAAAPAVAAGPAVATPQEKKTRPRLKKSSASAV